MSRAAPRPDSGRVVAPAPEGVTAADALEGAPASGGRAVFLDGVDGILAARGVIPAVSAQQRAERGAVQADQPDEQAAHERPHSNTRPPRRQRHNLRPTTQASPNTPAASA